MRFITRSILVIVFFLALLSLAALSVRAQEDGQLSDEEQALLDRVFLARDVQDGYASYQEEATQLYVRDTLIEFQGQSQTQQQVTDYERSTLYTQAGGQRDFAATMTNTETATVSEGDEDEVTEVAISAEARYVDGVLYVSAAYDDPSPDFPALPEGWVIVDDPAGNEIYALLELDNLVEDDPMFEDEELVRAAATSVTLEAGTGEDGAPVDLITVSFEGQDSVLAVMKGASDGIDPAVETIVTASAESRMVLTVTLDAENNPLAVTSSMLIVAEDLDGQALAPDRMPEGVLLDVRYDLQQTQAFSAANAAVDPITAPEDMAE